MIAAQWEITTFLCHHQLEGESLKFQRKGGIKYFFVDTIIGDRNVVSSLPTLITVPVPVLTGCRQAYSIDSRN